jgi:hypothetical protein
MLGGRETLVPQLDRNGRAVRLRIRGDGRGDLNRQLVVQRTAGGG